MWPPSDITSSFRLGDRELMVRIRSLSVNTCFFSAPPLRMKCHTVLPRQPLKERMVEDAHETPASPGDVLCQSRSAFLRERSYRRLTILSATKVPFIWGRQQLTTQPFAWRPVITDTLQALYTFLGENDQEESVPCKG